MAKVTIWHESPKILDEKMGAKDAGFEVKEITVGPISPRTYTTHVVPGLCGDCIYCEGACPNLKFNHEKKSMEVNPIGCRGCGVCLPACPTSALQQRNSYLGRHETDMYKNLNQKPEDPPVACNYCQVVVGHLGSIPAAGMNVRVVCSGRFEASVAIEALSKGYDKVLVVGCLFNGYPFEKDKGPTEDQIKFAKALMGMLGLKEDQLLYVDQYVSDGGVKQCLQNLK
jgi:Fe-S-cluster-containing hydrogenase component 2